MANPQKEDGYVALANDIVEALARINLSGREMRCLWVIFRKTYGWHKKTDLIALSQFSFMTGLSRQVVCKVLRSLLLKKIIVVDKNDNSQINSYRFNKDFDKWEPLPKKTTLLSKKIITVDVLDNQVLSKKTHTKETLTKETIQKKYIAKISKLPDPEWIEILKKKDCYSHLNINTELEKCLTYFETKNIKVSRQRFLNWLNRNPRSLQKQDKTPLKEFIEPKEHPLSWIENAIKEGWK